MKHITATNQEELDSVPVDFDGRIYIKFGTSFNRAIVKKQFKYSVVACGNSYVVACGNSSVEAMDNSSVEAWDNSSVEAWGKSSVVAWGNSSVVAWDNSFVDAWCNSSVVAWGNSSVEAWGNSSVEAWGNSQITDRQRVGSIKTNGNARVVYDPKTIEEYIDSIGGLEFTDTTVKLYKAVHKKDNIYFSDFSPDFRYAVGETATADKFTENPSIECGHGIHMADKSWCVAYGQHWSDLAILEVEVEKTDIVVPLRGCGKVRAKSVKVIREVPLEECGLIGQIVMRRR